MSEYKYLYFCVPIEDTLLDDNCVHKSDEVDQLIDFMEIKCDLKIVTNAYLVNCDNFGYFGKGDVFVFFDSSHLRYIVFDLYHGYTDHHDMIIIGVKCRIDEFDQVYKMMEIIYDKCCPSSSFNIDSEGLYLEDLVNADNYPRLVEDTGHMNYQNIFIYEDGKRINS